jgi:hypothetical protein
VSELRKVRRGSGASLLIGAILAVSIAAFVFAAIALARPLWPTLSLASDPPGARVVLDGHTLPAATPLKVRVKPYFKHTIQLELDGHPSRTLDPIELGFRDSPTYSLKFERWHRYIHLMGHVGTVALNGRPVGTGRSVELPELDLQKPVTVRVEAPGMKIWTYTFDKPTTMPLSLDVPLEPLN